MSCGSRITGGLAPAAIVLLLSGCFLQDDTRSTGGSAPEPESTAIIAKFNPGEEIVPFPANLVFSPDPVTGLLQVGGSGQAFVDALADLNGFSTIEPWTTAFTGQLDPETLPAGVRVFELDSAQPPFRIQSELVFGEDFVASPAGEADQLVISPLRPLSAGTNHLVVLTDDLRSADGGSVSNSLSYRALKSPEPVEGEAAPLQALVHAELAAAEAHDQALHRGNVVLAWSVRTQDLGHTLASARQGLHAEAGGTRRLELAPLGSAEGAVTTPRGGAEIWVGTVNLRYGLGLPATAGRSGEPVGLPAAAPALTTPWRCGGDSCNSAAAIDQGMAFDATAEALQVPVVVTVPVAEPGPGGYPVVLFKHGLGQSRADMLAVADQFAESGLVTVAMDLPLHGIVRERVDDADPLAPLKQGLHADTVNALLGRSDVVERTLYLDAEGDGRIDASGASFLNFDQPLVLRDNLRQAAVDLMALHRALDAVSAPGHDVPALNTDAVHLHGISLGASVAIPFLAVDEGIAAAALGVPGGGLARQAVASPVIGEPILGEFESRGISPESAEFQQIQLLVQTAIDAGDPVNYAPQLDARSQLGVLLTQVVGGAALEDLPSQPDQVLPPRVEGAPLSGSEVLSRLAGLEAMPDDGEELPTARSAGTIRSVVSFTAGEHSSYLKLSGSADGLPAPNPVEAEMRRQYGSFLDTGGAAVQIGFGAADAGLDPDDILRRD